LSNSFFSKNVFRLNPKLVAWAFEQTRELKLLDSPKVASIRSAYVGYPNAQRAPFVMIGDDFASVHPGNPEFSAGRRDGRSEDGERLPCCN